MQEWTSDTLWAKAASYAQEALSADPKGVLFPLLASFCLELLGKASLAKIHPALIADPRGEGENLLYAFGAAHSDPRTIVSVTVFKRLGNESGFTEDYQKDVRTTRRSRRNRQLHTGELAFHNFKYRQVGFQIYRVTKLLTEVLGRELKSCSGQEHAKEADEAAAVERARVQKVVKDRIEACKRAIKALRPKSSKNAARAVSRDLTWRHRPGEPPTKPLIAQSVRARPF